MKRMEKKLAVITGADGGMGTEITRAVALVGYRVLMACYDMPRAEEKKQMLVKETGNDDIEVRKIDLASLDTVAAFANRLLNEGGAADEQCRYDGDKAAHHGGWTGADGQCQLCRSLSADEKIIAIDGRRKPCSQHGFVYLCNRKIGFSGFFS